MLNLLLAMRLALALGSPLEEVKWTEVQLKHVNSPVITSLFSNQAFNLPPGIEKIVALNDERRLLIHGDLAGTQELTELILLLDKPLAKFDIETWLVAVEEKALPPGIFKLKLQQGPITAQEARANIYSLSGSVEDALAALRTDGKANMLASSRALHDHNRIQSLITAQTRQHHHAHIIIPTSAGSGGIIIAIGPLRKSAAGSSSLPTTLLNLTLTDGGAIALTAPGFTRDDGMLLIVRVRLAR